LSLGTAITARLEKEAVMNQGTIRLILRWVHIIVAIPLSGYIYSPFEELPLYAHPARFVFFPLMVLTGLLMWKGHLLWRRVLKRSA
jgi:thiosulfate reductase cytochrome b subunit